jgi:2-oxoglutarate ferredoxin oxidoreductase subunit alpha
MEFARGIPEYKGDETGRSCSFLGSSKDLRRSCLSDVISGVKAATLHFSQVWPMVPDQFLRHLERAKQVICVESNATGQLVQLIRRETGFFIEKRISRYDGLTMTPQYILRNMKQ